jgi:gliding motility-associated-like protein
MYKKILLFFIYLSVTVASAQRESNLWYFGDKAGLDFNGASPQVLSDGQLFYGFNCATISDENGDLLFYTNGVEVYDKLHNLMPNGTGLLGNVANPQGVTIIPKPLTPGTYYIFTADYDNDLGTVRYSEVNMALNGGLGDVTQQKNIALLPQSARRMTAILHDNGDDVWLINHDTNTNAFFATLITAQGISPAPVVSNTGPVFVGAFDALEEGCIKVSPNGENIVMSYLGAQLYDFNDATGQVSNPVVLTTLPSSFGVEFAPLSKRVYVTEGFTERVYQYNLEAADIAASEVEITGKPDVFQYLGGGGALQLAIDGKIYYATSQTSLNVINYPDVAGTGCWFDPLEIELAGRDAVFGLPAFIQSYFIPVITARNLCLGDATALSLVSGATPDSALWDFGDGATSTDLFFTQHTYAAPGTYNVVLTLIRQGQAFVYNKYITIQPLPVATQPADVLLCADGSPAFLDLSTLNGQILGTQPLNYVITYHSTPSDAEDGINALPFNYEITANSQMVYARVTSPAGCHSVTGFTIKKIPAPTIMGQDNYVVCRGETITLTAQGAYGSYVWSTGATTPSIVVAAPGNYSVTGVVAVGNVSCPSETVVVTLSATPQITDVAIADWSNTGNSIEIIADGLPTGYEYSVDGINFQESPLFTGLGYGPYTVFVQDTFGCGLDSKEIYLLTYPKFFTPNGDGINDIWQLKGIRLEPDTVVEIYDRFGKLLTTFDGRNAGWNGKNSGQPLPATDYWFVVKRQSGKIYKGHFSLLR